MTEPEAQTPTPAEILAEIKVDLDAPHAETRLSALQRLSELAYSTQTILHTLEQMALNDRSKAVRKDALDLLAAPLYRQLQRRNTKLPLHTRQMILGEIETWRADGLLNDARADVLRQRYDLDPKSAPASQADARTPAPRVKDDRTFAQRLFSETSIKISLYLGAFFIASAAMIFAAMNEELRLLILLFFTAVFGGASFALKKKLPQPSFTLFIMFSVFLPIDFGVIADFANFSPFTSSLYWMFVYLFMAGVWSAATWFFRSRFFSLTAFISLGLGAFFFADLFNDPPIDLYLLSLSFAGLAGLSAAKLLENWRDEGFARPLFWVAQAYTLILLGTSFFAFLFHYDDSTFGRGWWLATTAIWFLGLLFYALSNAFKKRAFFRVLAVLSAMPLLWLFLNTFGVNERFQASAFLVWGALFALAGEIWKKVRGDETLDYGQLLAFGALLLSAFGALLGIAEDETLGFVLLLIAALFYTLLSIYQVRWWTWAFALLNGVGAYFLFYQAFDFSRQWNVCMGYRILIPSLILLLPDLFLKNDLKANLAWRQPPRLFGAALTLVNSILALLAFGDELPKAMLIFAFYALLALGYAIRYMPHLAYLANTYLTLILFDYLRHAETTRWLYPFIGLAVIFYLLGWTLEKLNEKPVWGNIYRYSGLAAGVLLSLSAPLENSGLAASIPVVIAAGLFTIEAFRKRNLWLGFPANALYLLAYFMILINFEIDQPQFFSVVAAALGMLMHYLLVRAESKTAAFITGMLSQLVLLSVTYFQMVDEEALLYFAVLFFQALVVLVYGVIIRSRSMVITPIIFLVVGVLTVTFGLLDGLPTIFLIGCTGSLLIAFGIGALLMRERVADFRDKLDDWES